MRDWQEIRGCQLIGFVDDHQIERTRTKPMQIGSQEVSVGDDDPRAEIQCRVPAVRIVDTTDQFCREMPVTGMCEFEPRKAVFEQSSGDIIKLTYARRDNDHTHLRTFDGNSNGAFHQECLSSTWWRFHDKNRI